MMRFVREFRLIPVVLFATICLLGLKVLGIVLDGGFTLADLDFGNMSGQVAGNSDAASPNTAAKTDALTAEQRAKTSWAQEIFGFPDVTGSIAGDKPAEKPAGGSAATPPLKLADAKPPETKPASGGTVVPLDANGVKSPAERAILERLGERRQELEARARELEIRENLLKSAEKRLDGRVNEIKGMETQLNGTAQKKEENDAVRLKGLVTMYENMKAKDAAKIFDRLEMRVLIEVVSQINPRRMGDIMALMQPEMAERLTVELAARATGAAPPEPAVQLPKIEGRVK
jgi:flagellar motility protein MotE (MotC chaperone)